jgi:hypothetical protein
MAGLQSGSREPQHKKPPYPVVDYNAPEPSEPDKRAKRREKGKKYDKAIMSVNPSPELTEQIQHIHFPPEITALPVSISAAVIVGKVTDAQAHLSPDKTGVYSEFDVLVDEVIKNDNKSPLNTGCTVAVERPGGRVRIPTGQVQEYKTNLNALEVGSRYALFLVRIGNDFRVLTGYKIDAGKVSPLDDLPVFSRYKDATEASFFRGIKRGHFKRHPKRMVGKSRIKNHGYDFG